MDSFFGKDNGLIVFGQYDLVFAPEGPAKAVVGVVNSNGDVLAQHAFLPNYRVREGVFARLAVDGPADLQLSEPGIYTMVFVVDGKPITRFPFILKQTGAGDDPYNPKKTYAFDGYWRQLAHITTSTLNDEPIPIFSVWLGGLDLPAPEARQGFYRANLYRNGTLLAHTNRAADSYSSGHFKRRKFTLFHPHEEHQEVNARQLRMKEMLIDGEYELVLERKPDGVKLRHFKFTVADGKITPLARTQLGFDPAVDFIVPRVTKKGSTVYEFVEAIWIGSQ